MARHEAGYTLVELVVVIGIFTTVMTLISVSFNRIVASSGQIVKSVETDIGGLIGLELLRCDLGSAGFGLPWSFPSGANFTYVEIASGALVVGDVDASSLNDSYPHAPRAYVTEPGKGYNRSDYLALKGTSVGMNETCRKWSYLKYSSTGTVVKASKSEVELKPGIDDRVVVINTGVAAGESSRELVTNGFGSSTFSLTFNEPLPEGFRPKSRQDSYMVYGVAGKKNDLSGKMIPLSFPFNRADYYIAPKEDISATCAPGTGVLYKTVINQNSSLTKYPLLDCVADLQVRFMLDSSNDGSLVSSDDISRDVLKVLFHAVTSDQADQALRAHVKEVRVYILAQQGKRDPGYSYPASQIMVGDRTWTQDDLATLGADWMHYHWKVYTIAVQPKNLD